MVDFECIKREDILYSDKIVKPKYNELHFYVYHKNTFNFVYTRHWCKYQSKDFTSYQACVWNQKKSCYFFERVIANKGKIDTKISILKSC